MSVFLPRLTVLLQCDITGGRSRCHCNGLRLRPPLTTSNEGRGRWGGGDKGGTDSTSTAQYKPAYAQRTMRRRFQIFDVSDFFFLIETPTHCWAATDKLNGWYITVMITDTAVQYPKQTFCKRVNLDPPIINQGLVSRCFFNQSRTNPRS